MRLLIVNPNTTEAMTERMAGVARAAAAPGTEIIALTAPRGFPYISSRAEAQVAGVVALEMIAAAPPADAAVIAAFGDPGLRAARELFAMPVVGLAEAAMLAACALGDRFAIVTFTPSMIDWYGEGVGAAGLGGRFAGFRVPPAARGPVADVAETMRADIETLVHDAAADGADVVILGGAPLAGLAGALEVPGTTLVDPVLAALGLAETLVRLAPGGAARRPPGKVSTGLDPALARAMGG